MTCCRPVIADTSRFFSALAWLHRVRFKWLGFESIQTQLLAGIQSESISANPILEVGCGPGYLHQHLLMQLNAATAIGVDLSANMLAEAKALAKANQLTDRVEYKCADFVELANDVNSADITILDKVVCCYPYPQQLIECSVKKTVQVYALIYPRDCLTVRWSIKIFAWLLGQFRCVFRPYLHNAEQIEAWVCQVGFYKAIERQTFAWVVQIYRRS